MHKFFKYLSVFCVLGALVASTAFANLIFTTLDQVLINLDGIYVNTEEGLQPVQSITEIEEGYLLAIPKKEARLGDWVCPKCGATNPWVSTICYNCDYGYIFPTTPRGSNNVESPLTELD